MGLAKIGGLIALFKLSVFLRFLHQRSFERQLVQQARAPSENDNSIDVGAADLGAGLVN
jgi:hypothetical protein